MCGETSNVLEGRDKMGKKKTTNRFLLQMLNIYSKKIQLQSVPR